MKAGMKLNKIIEKQESGDLFLFKESPNVIFRGEENELEEKKKIPYSFKASKNRIESREKVSSEKIEAFESKFSNNLKNSSMTKTKILT